MLGLGPIPHLPSTAVLAALAAAVLAAGMLACGEDSEDPAMPTTPATTEPVKFPRPQPGETLDDLRAELAAAGPVLAPSVSVLEAGERNRVGFGLFDRSRRQIADASVALYFAPVGGGGQVQGPHPARYESLAVRPQFQSESTASDPDAATSVYVAEVPFEKPGRYEILGVVALDDRLVSATSVSGAMTVSRESPVPEVGEPAPAVSTPTLASAGGAIDEIDTRVPPAPELHQVDFADVVGSKPVVLIFATPALCRSRVCGPVVDVALEVQAAHQGEDVEFIHMEIYEDNDPGAGFRPQVREFDLPTEPWVFAIDREGDVAARIEGAFSARELEQAVRAATGE